MRSLLFVFTLLFVLTQPLSAGWFDFFNFHHKKETNTLEHITFTPKANEKNVSPDIIITATFDDDIDPLCVRKNNIIVKKISGKRKRVHGELSYNENTKTISFTPNKQLLEGKYRVAFKNLIKIQKDGHKHKKFKLKHIHYSFEVSEKPVDSNAPVITLNGESTITLYKDDNYFEEGATAYDDEDGVVDVNISSNVDTTTVGSYTVTYTAQDSVGNKSTLTRYVEVIEPPVVLESLSLSTNTNILRVDQSTNIILIASYSDGSSEDIVYDAMYDMSDPSILSINGNSLDALAEGTSTITATLNGITSNTIQIEVKAPIDTSNFNFTHFGSQYTKYIPADATLTKYDEELFAMVTGKILAEDSTPLSGVKVTIHNHPEYGSQITNAKGEYYFATEGAAHLTMRYQKNGFTTIDRKLYVQPQDWSIADDVTMLQEDIKVTTIDLSSTTPQLHISTPVVDDRGQRSATIVFDGITKATVTSKDGTTRELTSIDVRATEFKTPKSMPSDLPIETAYTYCTDIKVDGVSDDENVTFNAPVVMYVENFLGFNVGEIVPVGYYDRNKGKWIGSENGVVVELLDTDGDGVIDALDSTGDGQANDIDGDGLTEDEVTGIKDNPNYQAGNTYWRSKFNHFTPWDCNWPYGPPSDAESPDEPDVSDQNPPNDCGISTNSYITTKTRVFHEDIPIAGTDKVLHYSSKRVDGYKHIIDTSINTSNIPSSVQKVSVKLKVAGHTFVKEATIGELSNLQFIWDGKDILGNKLSGESNAKIIVSYEYNLVYYRASSAFTQAWAQAGTGSIAVRGRSQMDMVTTKDININTDVTSSSNTISNGWSIEDNIYLRLFERGILQGIKGRKYIEIKNGLLFSVENEPKNRLNYFQILKDRYFALYLKYPSASLGSLSNTVSLISFNFIDGKKSNKELTTLGTYSNFNFKLSYEDRPENGYDVYALHKGTIYEGISDRNFLDPSKSIPELKKKLKARMDTSTPFMIVTNSNGGDINRDDNYWTVFQPDKVLLDKLNQIYNIDTVLDLSTLPEYQNIGIRSDNIVVFEGKLGYVFNKKTGILEKVFDNDNKIIISEYTHNTENLISSITDNFSNITTVTRDYNDVPTLITAPNGQKTYLNISENGDLNSVEYEDGSVYNFEYDNNSLMTRKIDPNGNEATMYYDENGRIYQENDHLGANWDFSKINNENKSTYIITKPEGDETISTDTKQGDGSTLSQISLPSGDTVSSVFSENQMNYVTTKNGVETNVIYIKDILNQQKILSSYTTTQPSGLKNITTYHSNYDGNQIDINYKTKTITKNSKVTKIVEDYNNATKTITTPESRTLSSSYNKENRLTTSVQSGTLLPTTYEYDAKGRVVKEMTGSRIVSYSYDSKGNIATVTNAKGETTNYAYDIMDRVTTITYPNGTTENYEYDFNSNMTKLTTPTPSNFNFTYNGIDKRTSLTSPLGYQTSYTYNKNRKLTSTTRPSGNTISNTYVNDRLTSTTTSEGTVNYTYLFDEKVGSITDANAKIVYGYDGELLTSVSQSGVLNQSINYTYNNDFLVTSSTYAGATENYTYDDDGLLTSSGAFNITRDADNGYATKVSDGVLNINKEYNDYGELISKSDNTLTYQLQRDAKGMISQKTESLNGVDATYDYEYDSRGRLTTVTKDNQTVENYTYDKNGNRVSATINGVTTTAYYTLDDQTEVYGDNTYTYDEDGQLVSKQSSLGTTTYTYNTYGTLTGVTLEDGTAIKYHLNPLNQKIAKEVNGVIVEKYLWENLTTLLAIYDGNDNLVQRYNYSDERVPISLTQDNQTYYLHYDQVGTLKLVTDAEHNVVKEITYDTYGNILNDSNLNFKIPFGFAGGLSDRDTNLVHFGHREYDPYAAKWTTKDPIDFSGGDTNLYGYVLNDPVNLVDPTGEFGVAGAAAGGFVGLISSFIDPCTGQVKFQGYKNLAINTLSGAAFGAIGASFSNLTYAGAIGGLGTSFLSSLVNYASAPSCKKEESCQ
ncbi:DUF5011 domain-containing protein [Sulfurimonas lithotrophica]|uniref:DUF5011 domain-containing protein n=1 Tax=Sulfurimonas lithotrophica TaxID=2590022 RepID=A0A5P8NZF2_9BACT|nr:RHS repeat-associated core domain-containing protein [Sulfurimonas lithotrophica]QFR48818.1 DUF5011 domain-containing protein [Sulfurimonas lithotrophica]